MNIVLLATLVAYAIHAVWVHSLQGPEADETDTHLHRGMPFPIMPLGLFLLCQALGSPGIAAFIKSPGTLIFGSAFFLWMLYRQVKKNRTEADGGGDIRSQCSYALGGVLQSGLLVVSCYLAYEAGAIGRSLFSPGWGILGVVAGHFIFGVSLCFSHRSLDSLKNIGRYVLGVRSVARFAFEAPRQVFACLDVSLMEEIIYRVAAQSVLVVLVGNPTIAIVLVAIIFSIVHRHFFYNPIVDSIEFLAFSLLLGGLYYWSESLILVVMIHTIRNFEIVYFDHAEGPLAVSTARALRLRA